MAGALELIILNLSFAPWMVGGPSLRDLFRASDCWSVARIAPRSDGNRPIETVPGAGIARMDIIRHL